jgi:hypothetical protein
MALVRVLYRGYNLLDIQHDSAMIGTSRNTKTLFLLSFLMLLPTASPAQNSAFRKKPSPAAYTPVNAGAEDISGTYSFLKDDEFVQINMEETGVSGYISRQGDMESDRGQFLDMFFNKAAVQGHTVSFATKTVHGVRFEFKGRFERGPGKTQTEDNYYLLRGTLTEFRNDAGGKATSRPRDVEFKWLAQPER